MNLDQTIPLQHVDDNQVVFRLKGGEGRLEEWEEHIGREPQAPTQALTLVPVTTRYSTQGPPRSGVVPAVDDIYLSLRETESALRAALTLLDEALEDLVLAISAAQAEDLIAADDEMQQLQALLPELFCCRSLGDGLGAVVNAIQLAFANKRGLPFNFAQIEAVKDALDRVRRAPFLSLDEAVTLIEQMEVTDLLVEPSALAHLADL